MGVRTRKMIGVLLIVLVVTLGGMATVSCDNEPDGPVVEHVSNFGEGDICREIPAKGGSVVLFDGNDVTFEKYYDWGYAIDLPLDVIDCSEDGGFALLSKELSGEDKSQRRVQFENYRYGNYIDGGHLSDPGCELYFFTDAYSGDAVSNYSWMHYLPLFTGVDMAHYAEIPGWGVISFFKNGSAMIDALPNETGKERFLSLVYDRLLPESVMSGSVEIRQLP